MLCKLKQVKINEVTRVTMSDPEFQILELRLNGWYLVR